MSGIRLLLLFFQSVDVKINEAKCQACFAVPDIINVSQIIVFTVIIVTCLKLKDFPVGDHPFHQPDKTSSLDELSNKNIPCQLSAC